MSNCFLWILLLCCCGKSNRGGSCGSDNGNSCGCSNNMNECARSSRCCEKKEQPPRPRCVMPADEKFICKADNEESFLDEKVYE